MKSYTRVDLQAALDSVSPAVKRAYEKAHELLRDHGIPHVLIGGLAVNAYGHHYTTHDVDFLVAQKDVFDGAFVLTHKLGVPFKVGGVSIDYLPVETESFPPAIKDALNKIIAETRKTVEKVAVIPDWLLVWTKLHIGRAKDQGAIVELIHSGLDVDSVLSELERIKDERVLGLFARCVEQAETEERK